MNVDLKGLFSHCGHDYNALHRFLKELIDDGEIDSYNAERIEKLANELRHDIVGLLCIIHPDTGKCLIDEGMEIENWWDEDEEDEENGG